ncbi:MAG: hypothetical protein AB1757_16395 [Acidobacteriota bacterium]
MRSVFGHLKNAPEEEVIEWLTSFVGMRSADGMWRYPNEKTPVLYIEFYHDYQTEFESEDYQNLLSKLGNKPSITIVADVSGRVPGITEVKLFIIELLKQFDGWLLMIIQSIIGEFRK